MRKNSQNVHAAAPGIPGILLLEDNATDAELVIRELRRAGLYLDIQQVETRDDYVRALTEQKPSLIISDYTLPGFDGLSALDFARQIVPASPFIFVSGTIGEERAIEALKRGATDYVSKDNLRRVGPAVRKALADAQESARRDETEKALREAEERYQSLVELSPDAILTVSGGVITFANKAALKLYRATRNEQLLGKLYIDLVHEDSLGSLTVRLSGLQDHAKKHSSIEQKHKRLDGSVLHVETTSAPVPLDGNDSMLIIARDVSERNRYQAELEHQATHDALTGLPNRNSLKYRLSHAIASARRQDKKVAITFIDLDNFKSINDTFGHEVGDEVLKVVAARLAEIVRSTDAVVRLGGDEFVLLFTDLDDVDIVTQLMHRALPEISRPINALGNELVLTFSAGISIYPLDAPDADVVLSNADKAMYRAKQKGRNTFEYFTPDLNSRSSERQALSVELRRAVEKKEFFLCYQPQVDILSGRLTGAEALIRWNHPERGILLPEKFLPLSEELGLIVPIGEWVLQAACNRVKTLRTEQAPFTISVNISPVQFRQASLVPLIERVLRSVDLEPQYLELDLKESMLTQDPRLAMQTMKALKALGVGIAIDEFGAGNSGLAHLSQYPVDRLKIDKGFVNGIGSDPDDEAICRTIILLARDLKLQVIAEGVSTEQQLDFLRTNGCDAAQGYLFSGNPITPEETPVLS
ncbi:MAG TPA: EAL domain-containing protein [Burkholderiales bacterium]|nr:EAL domain-containing protein [Burkholderiales bacterium]